MKSFKWDSARAVRPEAVNGGVERDQGAGPIAAGIGFGERSADGAAVSHLHVGNASGAVVQDGNLSRKGGVLDFGMTSHGSEMQRAAVFLLIKEVPGMKFRSTRCSGLAKRSLSSGIRLCPPARNLALSPELAEHRDRFLQRRRSMIMK